MKAACIVATSFLFAHSMDMSQAIAGDHPHHVGVFAGGTSVESTDGHGKAGREFHATVGLEYEFRLPILGSLLGAGAIAEHVIADHSEEILLVGAFVHPLGGLKLGLMGGGAIADGHSELVTRGLIAYDIELPVVTVSPSVAMDYIAHHYAYVLGVAAGVGF